jgi:DNA polymerase I-like protein with 3'-5' exonuclease and polymerase domains
MQNGMYDAAYFLRWGIVPSHYLWDTQHLFHSWYSELPKRLDFITAFSIVDVRFWKDDGKSGNLQDFYRYNALDGWATLNTFLALVQDMPEWAWKNYFIEFPLVFPSFQCAMEGFLLDQKKFTEVREQKEIETEALKEKIQTQVGAPGYNPNSSQQTVKLMKVLGAKDATSAEEKELKKLQATTPFNNLILINVIKYKKEKKLLSTYFQESKVWHGRIYYSLNPAATDTARLASRESAYDCGLQIQNILRGDTVKQCFMADTGWKLGTGDFPQSEARCVAYLSGDEKLLELVESDKDYHAWNAQEFFGIPYEEIWDTTNNCVKNKVIRDLSKRTNHGANYNMGAQVMLDTMGPEYVQAAKQLLKLPADWSLLNVCQFLLDRYAATYPRVKNDWYQSIVHRVETTHLLTSPLGWVRYCFGNPGRSKPDLNAYVAHEPQNLSVALINKAFYRIWLELQVRKYRGLFRLKAQIHDEILFQYRPEIEADLIPEVKQMMTIPTKITDVGGKTRTMIIHPQMSWGKQYWSQLK